ncbi:PREDICTED: adhesion G protein-coupled receptor G3-like, partial [Cyprinodon variegatus]|uniref:adhesion G protein-coupled receptor G3-like n=1 Tax=Cyprinodon variegatus TaxID=28743 RepID=UPI000742509C
MGSSIGKKKTDKGKREENRAVSPASSGVSKNSDHSKPPPKGFSYDPGPKDLRLTEVQKMEDLDQKEHRAEPPGSSCLAMRSDGSIGDQPNFRAEPEPSDIKGQNRRQRAELPGSSCPSMRSDRSIAKPPDFSAEPPASSCLSMRSDWSIVKPPDFMAEPPGSSCPSMRSDWSINPILKVDASSAETLGYISYVGSALSAFFAFCSLFIYVHFHRRRPEKALGIHMQLTGALLCLHLGFLSSSFLVHLLKEEQGGWVCRGLGFFLHWSLLATFTWIALEGFHLYLLLIRVFNIYVSRYLLKLSIVGWGFPTLVAVICGSLGVYGRYTLEIWDSNNNTSPSQICWMSSEFQQRHVVSYITLAFLCLTVLYNTCMLLVVVSKIWKLRGGQRNCKCSDWKMNKENWSRLWKDAAKVLGLSWVLGLPWGLASFTYVTLSGIYVFNILNSLQGVFIFLWAVALSCKYRSEKKSKVQDSSTQKITTSSVN